MDIAGGTVKGTPNSDRDIKYIAVPNHLRTSARGFDSAGILPVPGDFHRGFPIVTAIFTIYSSLPGFIYLRPTTRGERQILKLTHMKLLNIC